MKTPFATAAKPGRLSEQLGILLAAFAERSVRLRELLEITHGRGYTMLLILLALPFCTPIPLPGLSLPFGAVIALIGLRLSLRLKPWLPQRLLDTELPQKFFPLLLAAARRLIRWLEFFLRPRWTWLIDFGILHHLYGAIILVCGLCLMLPLPIPFSNGFPALTVVLVSAAILERDGYVVIVGLATFLATLFFLGTVLMGGATAVDWLHGLFGCAIGGGRSGCLIQTEASF